MRLVLKMERPRGDHSEQGAPTHRRPVFDDSPPTPSCSSSSAFRCSVVLRKDGLEKPKRPQDGDTELSPAGVNSAICTQRHRQPIPPVGVDEPAGKNDFGCHLPSGGAPSLSYDLSEDQPYSLRGIKADLNRRNFKRRKRGRDFLFITRLLVVKHFILQFLFRTLFVMKSTGSLFGAIAEEGPGIIGDPPRVGGGGGGGPDMHGVPGGEAVPGYPELVRSTFKVMDVVGEGEGGSSAGTAGAYPRLKHVSDERIGGDPEEHEHEHSSTAAARMLSVESSSDFDATRRPQHDSLPPTEGRRHENPYDLEDQGDPRTKRPPRRLLDEQSDQLGAQRIRKETVEYDRPKNVQSHHGDRNVDMLERRFGKEYAGLFEVDEVSGTIRQTHDGRPIANLAEARRKLLIEQTGSDVEVDAEDYGTTMERDEQEGFDTGAELLQHSEVSASGDVTRRSLQAPGPGKRASRLKQQYTNKMTPPGAGYGTDLATNPHVSVPEDFLNSKTNPAAGENKRRLATVVDPATTVASEFVKQEVCRGMDEKRPGYFCGERWGITNIVKIEDQWDINELEFFWDSHCTNPMIGTAKQQSYSDDTFSRLDTSPLAFDGNNKTLYQSNCGASLGGCPAFIPGVQGQRPDSQGRLNSVIYKQLVRSDDDPDLFGNVKLYDPAKTTVTQDGAIKCVRIFQSKITTRQAYHIAVVFWDTLQWVKYSEFDALAGGGWQSRPAGSITLWKLTNSNPTAAPWTVNELYFYGDRRCGYQLDGIPIGTENVRQFPQCINAGTCEDTSVEKIRDGDVTTSFLARCSTGGAVTGPCFSNYAFIGYDYGYSPRTVLCIKIWQEAHPGYGKAWHISQHSEQLRLESWDGRGWRADKDLFGLVPNQWNYDYAPMNTLWRITADEVIAEWRVAELELFNNPFCDTTDDSGLVQVLPIQRVPLTGSAFDSNAVLPLAEEQIACADSQILSSCSGKVFDGKIDTFWQGRCRPNEPCERESNYIGLFSSIAIDVQCFKMFQSENPKYSVSTVHISAWDGQGGWTVPNPWSALSSTIGGIQNDLGGGSWNRRPAFDYSMWKISNAVDTKLYWRVVDVHLYSDKYCTERMDGLAWIAKGATSLGNGVTMVADGNNATYWEVRCQSAHGGCDRFSAWFGVQRTYNRPAYLEQNIPRCIVIDQFRDAAFQSKDVRLETWNGIRWFDPDTDPTSNLVDYGGSFFFDIGGGSLQARPGFVGTQWRLKADHLVKDGVWQVHSLEFFEDTECKPEKEIIVDTRNVRAISSGFATGSELVDFINNRDPARKQMEGDKILAEIDASEQFIVMNAFDKNEETFWIDIRDKSPVGDRGMESADTYPLFLGVDFGNAPTMNVNCIRIWQHPLYHARDMKLEYWDGLRYSQKDYGIGQPWNLKGFSGGSWQRWPAGRETIWRIENAVHMDEPWEVDEFGFYDTVNCLGTPLMGDILVSGYRDPYTGTMAADGIVRSDVRTTEGGGQVLYPDSYWRSWCGPCNPREAYIGVDFGYVRRQVKCMRIFQSPAIRRQSPIIDLRYWDGKEFVLDMQKRYYSVGGGSWNRRPAASNSQFRLRWVQTRPANKKCDPGRPRPPRSWGVSEVEFFSDDDCSAKIPLENNGREEGEINNNIGKRDRNMVATVVSGGYRQLEAAASVSYDFHPLNAADGDLTTLWAADCQTRRNGRINDTAMCSERDWVGFDFGAPKTVKCIKILQARNEQNECCDPAFRLSMDRWNGTDWVVSTWRHEPMDDGTRPAVLVDADFGNMGQCSATNIEKRSRKETESCMIPLSSITRTLGHPLCIKHEWCTAIGFRGECCPYGDEHLSRCCCTYLKKIPIFVDEIPLADRGEAYNRMDLEMVTITWTKVLPFWFMIMTAIWFTLINIPEPEHESPNHKYWERHCLPLQLWFNGEGYAQRFLRNFLLLPDEKPERKVAKALTILVTFFIFGGALVWMILAYAISSFILTMYFYSVLVVKWCKSPYFPGHDHDEWRRHAITQVAINPDQSDVKYPSSLGLVKTMGVTLAFAMFFWARWVFDLLLFQSIMFIMGLGDTNISAYMIMSYIPRISVPAFDSFINGITGTMRSVLGLMPMSYMEVLFFFFNGIPRCKGPALLFGSMVFMSISFILVKALNYDFFGLFAAGRYAISTTKPGCQRALILFWNYLMEGFFFVTAQCALIAMQMFKDLALPGSENWMCPWSDDVVVVIAVSMLYMLMISTTLIVILCANGHFYGQDYILGPLGRQLNMNFDRLDPDGTGPDGGMINMEVLFAVLPTTVGIWRDDWNVPAYLMTERAHIYAEELWTPHKCDLCGGIHVPYEDLIRAQSRNVSLCYQALPFGLAFGKLCEYMNFPPLYYDGKKMRCLLKMKHSRRLEFEFYGKLMNKYLPMASAVLSLGSYFQLIITILLMTEANIASVATNSFVAAMVICFLKSFCHVFLRHFVMFLEGKEMEQMWKKNPRAKPPPTDEELKRKEKEKILGIMRHELPNMRILMGHLAHGIVVGSVFGGLAVSGKLISDTAGLWVGMVIGLSGGWLPIYMYYLTEMPNVSVFIVGLIKITFAATCAIGSFFLAQSAGYSFRFAQIMASVCFALLAVPAVVCFRKRVYDEHGTLSPSFTQEILFTYRGIPNYLAIITAMFITTIPAALLVPKPLDGSEKERVIDGITTQGNYRDLDAEKDALGYILFVLIFASYIVGIVAAYLVAEQLHKRPVVLAIAAGYMIILALQPFIFILFAFFVGTIFGLSVGAYIENREVTRIKGISLHDKIQVYGDLAQAESKAARVQIQKEQQRQAFAIQNAIDEQRPICLPGEIVTVEEFGDPEHPDYIAPLELPMIPSVAELVGQRLDAEEEIARQLKDQQASAAIQFASGLKDMQAEEQISAAKMESMSSIAQVNSANPNRSLIAGKTNMEKIKNATRQPEMIADQAMEVLLALENRAGGRLPQLALPGAQDAEGGDLVQEEEEEEEGLGDGEEAGAIEDVKVDVAKTPAGDQLTGHELVLKEEAQQYSFDETVHQWYDPHTGYYYDETRQEWYVPGKKSGSAGGAGPPQAIRPLSLRKQADHIQKMQDRKKQRRDGL